MNFPQDVPSRHILNRKTYAPKFWAIAVVLEGKVVELQRWRDGVKVDSLAGPESRLFQFGTTEHRLLIFSRKNVWQWNATDGALAKRAYEKGEGKQEPFRVVPGEAQFRGQDDWCVAIIDGNQRACPPQQLFERASQNWQALTASQRSSLLGAPLVAAFGGHMMGALKILKYVAAVLIVVVPLLWFFFT